MLEYVNITRYDSKGVHEMQDPVVRETLANLVINGAPYLSMMCLPQDFKEWAVGFMFSEGIIKSFAEIKGIEADREGNIFVNTWKPVSTAQSEKRVLVSGCAHGTVNMSFLNEKNLPEFADFKLFSCAKIIEMMEKFNKASAIFNEGGGVHSAALRFKNGEGLFFEDIGRHNAVDKVIGAALMQNLPIGEAALLTSGRVSTEIALKTIRAGVAMLISRSGPTTMSLAIVEKANMTLVGFARARRFYIYHGEARISYDSADVKTKTEVLAKELRANLFVNGELYLSMMCLPQHFEEMAVGLMFSEGLIKSFGDIEKIEATCTGNIFVFTRKAVDLSATNEDNLRELTGGQKFSYNEIVSLMDKFNKASPIFNEGCGVHFAALHFKSGEYIFYEDVGRHNAVDKVVGAALMQNLQISEATLLISGRISTEIVLKTARLGISVLISQSGPTSVSLGIARKTNMTLIGFARGLRFNVYSGGFRVGIRHLCLRENVNPRIKS